MPSPIRILCYGDSNTWGYVPGSNHERFNEMERYPKVLQKLLGTSFEIIEEGLNGRTLVSEDERPNKEGRKGNDYLIPCLDSHDPLDLVVIMLGTNEMKQDFHRSAEEIGALFEEHFVRVILGRVSSQSGRAPKLLIVSPPSIDESAEHISASYAGVSSKVAEVSEMYRNVAKTHACPFIDGSFLEVGSDGVHLIKESHNILATELARVISSMHFLHE